MSLYTIGDLHLSLNTEKPMDVFGGAWVGYVEKIEAGFSEITDDDTVVLCGDISWGMSLDESEKDFLFISHLPGKKIILKGNHDYWWTTAAKMKRFFAEKEICNIEILHNNCFFYENMAICGTRGWFFEEEYGNERDEKVYRREVMRLETSLKAAKAHSIEKILVFLHYPPIFQGYECPDILHLLDNYNVALCCYGHLHGFSHRRAIQGKVHHTEFQLVSADYLNFKPIKII